MFAMNCKAAANVIVPLGLTQTAGVVGLVQYGNPKVLLPAKFAFASHVTFATGS